jgi:hypothetical protein
MSLRWKCMLPGIVAMIVTVLVLAFFLLPLFSKAHARSSQCVRNLMMIHNAEQTWASMCGKPTNAIPTWNDLKPFLHLDAARERWTNDMPNCPQGGTYILTPVYEYPKCSIGGPDHSIPIVPPSPTNGHNKN